MQKSFIIISTRRWSGTNTQRT